MGKEREGVLLPGKYHKGEEEREFKLTNGQIRAKRLRKQESRMIPKRRQKGIYQSYKGEFQQEKGYG